MNGKIGQRKWTAFTALYPGSILGIHELFIAILLSILTALAYLDSALWNALLFIKPIQHQRVANLAEHLTSYDILRHKTKQI